MSGLDTLPWKDYLTTAAAVLGAALGIMNTWNAINQRRVRLRVRPLHTVAVPTGAEGFAIEVTNLSAFAVTIEEVGFALHWRGVKSPRAVVAYPELFDGKPWPRRLESREAVTVRFPLRDMEEHRGRKLGKAYASTACGISRYGDSPALDGLRKRLLS